MDGTGAPSWTFLTNHARVLILIARDPGVRLRDVATQCTITERTAQAIVADLEEAGYLTHTRRGRRNHYEVVPGTHFRHPAEASHEIAGLLSLIADETDEICDEPPDQDRADGDDQDAQDPVSTNLAPTGRRH